MKAQIITIGNELLIGQTIDTNSAWIGSELSRLGFDIYRKITSRDNKDEIIDALELSAGKSEVVLITGGLGPTSDDITKQALIDFFKTRLVVDHEVMAMITDMLKKRNLPLNENNRRQAEIPESCLVLTNAVGTAPGMWFEKYNTVFISMPGVPSEMKYIMHTHVFPRLKSRFMYQNILHRNIMLYGIPEASLAELLASFESELPGNVKLAYLPSFGIIKLRLTGTGKNRDTLDQVLDKQVMKLRSLVPGNIFSEEETTMETVVGTLLRQNGQTICTAESCTGGNIAHLFTCIPGCSDFYKGSVIAYDNGIKRKVLDVPGEIIERYGAVSEEVVEKMAAGARLLLGTDYAVATSGIAGPKGGSELKPVGTVCISVAWEGGAATERHVFGNDRVININRFSVAALFMVWKQLSGMVRHP
jgi:nicotinamide-nucleotide amidase